MDLDRREFLVGAAALAGAAAAGRSDSSAWAAAGPRATTSSPARMHGLIGKMTATPGQRDALVAILLEGTAGMPGCLSYVIATDPADADAIWVTEGWDSEASHTTSLALPSVRQAIAKGRPLIAGFGPSTVTTPVGGQGLARAGAPARVPAGTPEPRR